MQQQELQTHIHTSTDFNAPSLASRHRISVNSESMTFVYIPDIRIICIAYKSTNTRRRDKRDRSYIDKRTEQRGEGEIEKRKGRIISLWTLVGGFGLTNPRKRTHH